MSEERPVESTIITDPANVKLEDFNNLPRAEKKARLATVLERGLTADRLNVILPDNLYGEWCPNDPLEVARLQGMGFEVDTQYAPKRALHGSGSGEARVADVIFMTTNRETKELIDEIRQEAFTQAHGKPGVNKQLKEETEFLNSAQGVSGVRAINESAASAANYEALKEALTNTGE